MLNEKKLYFFFFTTFFCCRLLEHFNTQNRFVQFEMKVKSIFAHIIFCNQYKHGLVLFIYAREREKVEKVKVIFFGYIEPPDGEVSWGEMLLYWIEQRVRWDETWSIVIYLFYYVAIYECKNLHGGDWTMKWKWVKWNLIFWRAEKDERWRWLSDSSEDIIAYFC